MSGRYDISAASESYASAMTRAAMMSAYDADEYERDASASYERIDGWLLRAAHYAGYADAKMSEFI